MEIAGLAVTLLDTAGLRETDDIVERIGVKRALERAAAADLRVFLLGGDGGGLSDLVPQADDIVIQGKADLSGAGVSGKTGAGVDHLVALIGEKLATRVEGAGIVVRERHRIAVLRTIGALESAAIEVEAGAARAEIAAELLRDAIRGLEVLVGRVGVEDLLDEIFASFCIGK